MQAHGARPCCVGRGARLEAPCRSVRQGRPAPVAPRGRRCVDSSFAVPSRRERAGARAVAASAKPLVALPEPSTASQVMNFIVKDSLGQDIACFVVYMVALIAVKAVGARLRSKVSPTGEAPECEGKDAPQTVQDLVGMVFSKVAASGTVFQALERPINWFIYILAFVKSLEVLGGTLSRVVESQGAASGVLDKSDATMLQALVERAVDAVEATHDLMAVGTKIAVVWLLAWASLRWKKQAQRVVEETLVGAKKGGAVEVFGNAAVGASGLVSWTLVGIALLATLSVLHINIAPLLAVGGASGLVAGFAAQSVLTNILAGIQIFLVRPFTVGERLELRTGGGGKVIAGTVVQIDPTRTIIRADDNFPVSVPNKTITDMLVVNHSRCMDAADWGPMGPPSRPLLVTIPVRLSDAGRKSSMIATEVTKYLQNHPDVDHDQPVMCGWTGFGHPKKLELTIRCMSTREAAKRYPSFRDGVLTDFVDILDKYDGALA
ncbi:unnamed protein product [Pedinophyceae sp. YPF-701]|nr:unnamed protein product [Pedinophyceae sp. YPF-701]